MLRFREVKDSLPVVFERLVKKVFKGKYPFFIWLLVIKYNLNERFFDIVYFF
jgi:hypothetical protein